MQVRERMDSEMEKEKKGKTEGKHGDESITLQQWGFAGQHWLMHWPGLSKGERRGSRGFLRLWSCETSHRVSETDP